MIEQSPRLYSAWSFPLSTNKKEYRLIAKLYKNKLVIEDKLGNKILIQKKLKAIEIDCYGQVDLPDRQKPKHL